MLTALRETKPDLDRLWSNPAHTKHANLGCRCIVGVEHDRNQDQRLGKIGKDAPVAALVGIAQRGARHGVAEAHVMQFGTHCTQAAFDLAQPLALGQSGKLVASNCP